MKSCLFFFTILSGIALGSSFLAEEAAIRLNLPGLAKQTLLQHTLDAFPQGGKCHLLLAQIYYLEKNFPIMRSHLQRTNSDLENYYLNVLSNWFIEKKLNLIPLLLCAQEHPLGEFLADCNQILLEPLNSPQWAQFLGRQSKCYSLKTFHSLYSMLIEMKFSIDPGIVHTNLDKDNWEIIVPYLFAQRRFEKLEHELQQLLIKMPVSRERLRCFLWFIQVKQKQLKNCYEDVLSFLNTIENDTEAIDFILSEWLSLFSQEQQLDILKRFHKIYSKKHLKFQSDYLELLRIQLLLETGKLSVAEKLLHKNLNRFDTHLKSLAYELAAKLASLKNPVSYRQIADFLQEASKFSKTLTQTINYMQLEAQCYCLEKDYQRAYALYQEAFFKAISHEPAAKELAYEWCLCGILCDETLEDLNQQLAFCHANNCLALRQEQELKLTFFQHLLEQKRYKEIKKFSKHASFFDRTCLQKFKLLQAKCLFQQYDYTNAEKFLENCPMPIYEGELLADYYLWRGLVKNALDKINESQQALDSFFKIRGIVPSELKAQAVLLQAELFSKNHQLDQAKQILLDWQPQISKDWQPYFMFKAGCYAEENGIVGQKEAIQIFQKLYDSFQENDFASDARLKQGILLMNFNQMSLAKAVFESILPKLKSKQSLWCRYLIQKCLLMDNIQPLVVSQTQLEFLLKEDCPLSLRLEIVTQLAHVYEEQNKLGPMQNLLWKECYPLLIEKEQQNFSAKEVYWLCRCLLTLARYTPDKNISNQIYTLMVEAQLPVADLVRHYVEVE